MAITENLYTGNGSTTNYSFTFPYISETDVKVSLDAVDTTAYTFANATTIQFNTAPANGVNIRIYRLTDDSELSAEFYSGSAIRAQDLNDNFTQNLYVTQETKRDVADAVAGQIPDGSIGTSKLADGAVTDAKVTSIGAAKATFTQIGTGAVQRTVESKLQDVVSVKDFGAVGDGVTDDTAAIQAALNTNKSVYFPSGSYKVTSAITCSASNTSYRMDGELVIDYETFGTGLGVVTFSGNNINACLRAKPFDVAYVTANYLTSYDDAGYAFVFSGTNNFVHDSVATRLPNFVKFTGTDASNSFVNNIGRGLDATGLTAQFGGHTLVHVSNGERCKIANNTGTGFNHLVLFGLTTNNSIVSGNIAVNCANHLVYISSGSNNVIDGNVAKGINTDIKARGDNNIVTNNVVEGGSISITNQLVDSGNGWGLNGAIISGNRVACGRAGAYPVTCRFRTNYDTQARNIVISDNSITAEAVVAYPIFVYWKFARNISITGNNINGPDSDNFSSITDGIFCGKNLSSAGAATYENVVISNNFIHGAIESGIEAGGNQMSICSNVIDVAGTTGVTKAGLRIIEGTDISVHNNIVQTSTSGGVVINLSSASAGLNIATGNVSKSGGVAVAALYDPSNRFTKANNIDDQP